MRFLRVLPSAERFVDALNDQIANEFGAAMQYIGAAVYYLLQGGS